MDEAPLQREADILAAQLIQQYGGTTATAPAPGGAAPGGAAPGGAPEEVSAADLAEMSSELQTILTRGELVDTFSGLSTAPVPVPARGRTPAPAVAAPPANRDRLPAPAGAAPAAERDRLPAPAAAPAAVAAPARPSLLFDTRVPPRTSGGSDRGSDVWTIDDRGAVRRPLLGATAAAAPSALSSVAPPRRAVPPSPSAANQAFGWAAASPKSAVVEKPSPLPEATEEEIAFLVTAVVSDGGPSSSPSFVGAKVSDITAALSRPVAKTVHFMLALHLVLGLVFLVLTFVLAAVFVSSMSASSSSCCDDDDDSEIAEPVFPSTILIHRRVGKQERVWRVPDGMLASAVVFALVVACLWHFWCAFNRNGEYSDYLCTTTSMVILPIAVMEFALSSTLLVGVISVLGGVRDLHAIGGVLLANVSAVAFMTAAVAAGSTVAAVLSLACAAYVIWVVMCSVDVLNSEILRRERSLRPVYSSVVAASLSYGAVFVAAALRVFYPTLFSRAQYEAVVTVPAVLFKIVVACATANVFWRRYKCVKDGRANLVE